MRVGGTGAGRVARGLHLKAGWVARGSDRGPASGPETQRAPGPDTERRATNKAERPGTDTDTGARHTDRRDLPDARGRAPTRGAPGPDTQKTRWAPTQMARRAPTQRATGSDTQKERQAPTQRALGPDTKRRAPTQKAPGPDTGLDTKSAGRGLPGSRHSEDAPGPDTQMARRAPTQGRRAPTQRAGLRHCEDALRPALGPDTNNAGPRHSEGAPGPDTKSAGPCVANSKRQTQHRLENEGLGVNRRAPTESAARSAGPRHRTPAQSAGRPR